MIRILIADDHQLVRRGLRLLLEQEPDLSVVSEGSNGLEIMELLRSGVEADVLLADLNMPVMDGLELAKAIAEEYPSVQIILLTIQEEESYIQQAFQAGIKSYLFKTADAEEVVFAVRQVARKKSYLCADLAAKMIRRLSASSDFSATANNDVEFSDREMEVLRLIAAGFTNEEAADKLFTSRRTVEGHRQAMIDKTGSRNSLALVAFAIRHGLLS
jgi:two-component system response regulator NreC